MEIMFTLKNHTKCRFIPLPSFIHWSACWSPATRSAAKTGGGYYTAEGAGTYRYYSALKG
jgi:hypothetical protein